MLTVLSPAKSLDFESPHPDAGFTQPHFLDKAEKLARAAARLKPEALRELMDISEPLALLNAGRFRAFSTPFTPDNARPALFAFNGDVYTGLDATSLSASQIAFAQCHLRILSGLYGLLRPLDLMQPYRLEMGTAFATRGHQNLYSFWKAQLTRKLAEELDGASLVNLASQEYFGAVEAKQLPGGVVTPVFKEVRDGTPRIISFFAKKARGSMARFICQNAIDRPEGLKDFAQDGYRFDASGSDGTTLLFTRNSVA